ncbi:hypothetical protein M501DRAFT_259665 [Patellaria atrata CBS 101060]|uniref:DUF7918 domain-containing protein n=1 Tax=Patellaria atrata CBS 101060 TaxID=1346257 RepID=A0A9P4S4U0_9PEZI|nr:hypothetical protein M501DRAFT_259665 [Patellaria atrata CBS 101060]
MVPYSIRSQEEEEEEVFPMPGRFINDSGDESRKTQRAVRHRVSSLSGTRASPVGSVHKDISGGFSWGGPKSPDDNHSTQGWPQGDTDENEHKVQWVNGSDQDESKNTLWNSSNSVAGNWNDAKEDSNGSSWAVVRKSSTTRGWDQSKRNKEAKHDNWGSSQPDLGQEGKSKVDGTTENAGGLVSWDNDNNGDDDTWNNDNSWNDATGNNNSWNEYSGNKDTSNNEDDWNNDTNGNGGGWGTNSNANRNASNDNTNNKMDGWGNKTDNNGGEWNKNIDNNDGGGFNNELIDTDGNNGGFGDLPNSNANPDDSGSTTGWKLDGENRSVAGDWGSKSKSGSQLGGTTEWKADDGKSKVGSQTGGKTEWKEDDGKPTKSDAGSIKSKGPQAVEEAISKVGIHGKAPSKAASDIGAKTNVSRQSRTSNDTYQSGVSNVRVQPYWKKWNTLPPIEEVSSSQRHRSDQIYIAPEHPPMEVDEEVARRMKVENQVRTGPGAKYAHKTARPEYLDAMDKPYAVFRFKYRSKAMLEQILGMKIKEKKVDPRENLRKLSKDEIIEKYLKVKGEDKASVTGSGHSHHEGSHSRTNRRTDHKAPSHASDKPKAANCTGAASKPPSVTSNRQTQCDTPKPPSTTSNKQKDWAPDNQGAEGGALEWDQNANVDWDAGADLTADAEW